MSTRVRILFLALIALAAATALTAMFLLMKPAAQQGGGAGRLGGDFTLVDQDGKTVTAADYAGKYRLMFFGFTNCPDVCPTTLQMIADAWKAAPDLAGKVRVMLVSVDPERDTPAALKQYVTYFDPSFIGLTGTPEQVGAVLKAYGVYAKKVPLEDSALKYTMDHSAFIYLYGPDGVFITAFDPNVTPEDFAAKLKAAIG